MYLDLLILDGRQAGRRIPIDRTPLTVGRSPGVTVAFPEDRFMSSVHLKVQHALSGLLLFDLRSSNGTFLNGGRVSQALALPGDVIRIGTLSMQVVMGKRPPPEPLPEPCVEDVEATMPASAPALEAELDSGPASATASVPRLEAIRQILRGQPAPLFCLVDITSHDMATALLAVAPERRASLYGGADAGRSMAAPYLLEVLPDSVLLQVLVEKGWDAGCTSFFTSEAGFDDLAAHFQRFYSVQLEYNDDVSFAFHKPRVLREFFATATGQEVELFRGPVTAWLIAGEGKETVFRIGHRQGVVETELYAV